VPLKSGARAPMMRQALSRGFRRRDLLRGGHPRFGGWR